MLIPLISYLLFLLQTTVCDATYSSYVASPVALRAVKKIKKSLPVRAKPAFQLYWALCAVTSPFSTSGFTATEDGHLIYYAWIHHSPWL